MKLIHLILALAVLFSFSFGIEGAKQENGKIVFKDVRTDTAKFIEYYKTIKLTPAQEKIKSAALTTIAAPCCSKFSVATCCCPCNMAKTVWGLSNYAIAQKGYNTEQLKELVVEWLQFTNKDKYTGDACFTGGCGRAFRENGCGGMIDSDVVF
jgi:hypothetical protein